MPRRPAVLPNGMRLSDKLSYVQFVTTYPEHTVKAALAAAGRNTMREREMPNHLVVYFVMMLALFRDASAREVLRIVCESVRWLQGFSDLKIMAKSGISQAKSRVGWEPFARLFESVARPIAENNSKGSFFKGRRVVALDGSLFSVPDTKDNDVFGRPSNQHGDGGYPQARLVSLVECGTHAIFAANVGGFCHSEQALARPLLAKLDNTMICLADRYFFKYGLFHRACLTGAKLLWRAPSNHKLEPEQYLKDGSYLTHIFLDREGLYSMQVRVIAYTAGSKEQVRVVTNWLDPNEASARELAILYHQRWEYENMMAEFKVTLGSNEITLRSQKADLVKQEIYAMALAHYSIRRAMHEAACRAGLDDDELSFVHAVRVVRRRVQQIGHFPPATDLQFDPAGDFGRAHKLQPWALQS